MIEPGKALKGLLQAGKQAVRSLFESYSSLNHTHQVDLYSGAQVSQMVKFLCNKGCFHQL